MADNVKEENIGMDKDEIRKAISRVKLEDKENHERNIDIWFRMMIISRPEKLKMQQLQQV